MVRPQPLCTERAERLPLVPFATERTLRCRTTYDRIRLPQIRPGYASPRVSTFPTITGSATHFESGVPQPLKPKIMRGRKPVRHLR
jgi:hypothetical protein